MEQVNLLLTNDEALVLFELLTRYTEQDKLSVAHESEQQALYNLQATLEKSMSAPFQTNYQSLLNAARKNLVASND